MVASRRLMTRVIWSTRVWEEVEAISITMRTLTQISEMINTIKGLWSLTLEMINLTTTANTIRRVNRFRVTEHRVIDLRRTDTGARSNSASTTLNSL